MFLILTCILGGFLVYDKFIKETDNNIQDSKNDIEKLKQILKQQSFVNADQSVENYFDGYLNPIVEVMVIEDVASISTKKVQDLTEEDMARIVCLTSDAKMSSVIPHNDWQEKMIYQDDEVKKNLKQYFNKDNFSFSNFKKYDEMYSDANIVLNSDKSLTCNDISVSKTIEVTDVVYNEDTRKILVYIDAISPGQVTGSYISFTGTIELKYNDGNFNVVNLDFTNVLN